LADQNFKVREKAMAALVKLDGRIVPVLGKALASKPALETKQRLERVRDQVTAFLLTGENLRACRAVELLERLGTPEARQLLQRLAEGAPGAVATSAAQAALQRWKK
jgi:HEAT repeat protein